ncbi:MAG: MiaB/RimO family radical SAM methylthiotransferase [Tepidisphaerales bacterium]
MVLRVVGDHENTDSGFTHGSNPHYNGKSGLWNSHREYKALTPALSRRERERNAGHRRDACATNMRRKLYMETFGCQMNELDSELVLSQLRAHGYEQVDEREGADVVVYNTCSVREHAEHKVWSRLGELRPAKQKRPDMVIAVIGCMAEREGTGIFIKYPYVDILCGPAELDKLPGLLHNAVVTNERVIGDRSSVIGGNSEDRSPITDHRSRSPARQVALMGQAVRRSSTLEAAQDTLELLDLSRSVSPSDDVAQSYVRITRGCNKFCTYCVVPYTRGPEVHRPPRNILDEVKMLVDAGAREVTLLGQTINHYNFAHGDGRVTTFADLLYMIHEAVPSLPRLRFVTSFPRDFTDAALQAMRDCPRICRYLHVPAQSGSDRVLKAMNRGYTAQQYLDFIDRARSMMHDLCIASDFIVGFPGETEDDHRHSLDLIRHCQFKNSFIFKYSPRPGTIAIQRFEDDVPEETKRRRNAEMLSVQQEVSFELNRRMVGKTAELMVEGESELTVRQAKAAAPPAGNVELGWEKSKAARAAARIGEVPPVPSLAESPSPESAGEDTGGTQSPGRRTQLVGRTRGDQVVCFVGPAMLKGQILQVEITEARYMTLFGRRM